MRAVDIIARKRDGHELSRDELRFLIEGFVRGEVPDYQMSAWAMAVVWRDMTDRETADLTQLMVESGEELDWSDVAPIVGDKHSTGGVGDKTTLVVAPMVAAAGLPIGKMSGRGLGHTGGTLDKLESIPGFRVALSTEEFRRCLARVGLVIAGQTASLVPADGKLYALRDMTATVESVPLIASSVKSKKLAAGAGAIVLDVKCGSGAFMKDLASAQRLARTMVEIGRWLGRRVSAVITDMAIPLGAAVGHALEVREAIATLRGEGPDDLLAVALALGRELLVIAEVAPDHGAAERRLLATIEDGSALAKLRACVEAQGGDPAYVDEPERLPAAPATATLNGTRCGWLTGIDALTVGLTVAALGGGRARKEDAIDHRVGVVLRARVGERVEPGTPLAEILGPDRETVRAAASFIAPAFTLAPEPPAPRRLVLDVLR